MPRHSKNNTALGFFTNAERDMLTYGTQQQRVGRDSMKNFDACFLCLQTARDPMCCSMGHLACKECIFENILMQKKEMSRLKKLVEMQKTLIEDGIKQRELSMQQAEIEKFEKTQNRMTVDRSMAGSAGGNKVAETKIIDGKVFKGVKTTDGTLFVPDIASADEAEKVKIYEAMKSLESQAKEKSALHSFWVPSLTPDAKPTIIQEPSRDLFCTASDPNHTIPSFKKLIAIKFLESSEANSKTSSSADSASTSDASSSKKTKSDKICPTCVKTFTNGSKIVVLKSCGHALCKDCFTRFVKTSNSCHVCDTKCKNGDMIELHSEGTGFAGSGGKNQVTKVGIAFQ